MLTRRHALGLAVAMPAATLLPAAARTAEWPERPVHLIVPYAAGGNIDLVSRLVGANLSESLGQPVVVENRAGAGGSVGAESVARAAPDGYTLLAGSNGPITVNPLVQASLPYKPLEDFAPIAMINRVPLVLMVTGKVEARDLKALIAESKAGKGVATGTAGAGSTGHLALELFNNSTGAHLLHVPYRGGGAVVPDFIAGNIGAMIIEYSTALPLHRDGKGRILAIAAEHRSPLLPDVPTFIEQGVADFTAASYCGLFAPRATPAAVQGRLREAAAAAVADPGVRRQLEAMGSEMAEGALLTPEGFTAFLREQAQLAKHAADLAGLQPT